MQTFEEIKYEMYEKIENLLKSGDKIIINVTNKEGTICYNSFFIEKTTDRWRPYSYPKITNVAYTDTITPVYWGKKYGNTKELVRDYWLGRLEKHFRKTLNHTYEISDLYFSFGNDVEYKGESYDKPREYFALKKIETISKQFKCYMNNN